MDRYEMSIIQLDNTLWIVKIKETIQRKSSQVEQLSQKNVFLRGI